MGSHRCVFGLREPEAQYAVTVQEQDVHDIQLVAQDTVDPLGVLQPGPGDLCLAGALVLPQHHAGFRQLGEQAQHLVAAGKMGIEILEIGAQVLQKGLAIEEFHPVQHQRQIDAHRPQQRQQGEDEEKQQDSGSKGHVKLD